MGIIVHLANRPVEQYRRLGGLMVRVLKSAALALVITSAPIYAQSVNITADMTETSFPIKGQTVTIQRNQDPTHLIDPEFSKTSRACPPFCVTPISAADGVATVGELEVIDFLKTTVSSGTGLLLDTRTPEWFSKGSIPGALNVPSETLEPRNPYRNEILRAFGGVQNGESWTFAAATDLLLFCNGPWCDQSPRAIRGLLDAGYPADKIKYYRGGIQVWKLLGLTITGANN